MLYVSRESIEIGIRLLDIPPQYVRPVAEYLFSKIFKNTVFLSLLRLINTPKREENYRIKV